VRDAAPAHPPARQINDQQHVEKKFFRCNSPTKYEATSGVRNDAVNIFLTGCDCGSSGKPEEEELAAAGVVDVIGAFVI